MGHYVTNLKPWLVHYKRELRLSFSLPGLSPTVISITVLFTPAAQTVNVLSMGHYVTNLKPWLVHYKRELRLSFFAIIS